ncbi:hypothetical protein [Streptomyces lavendulocolor]|uniref:hypothetical protein n=1 Tax=Streptomyces lavendulocolor TaxID=67316 RepID=UPI0033F8BD81
MKATQWTVPGIVTTARRLSAALGTGRGRRDLRTGRTFRPGLRIKGVRRAPGVYELTWGGGGRATWSYGPEIGGVARRLAAHRRRDILDVP